MQRKFVGIRPQASGSVSSPNRGVISAEQASAAPARFPVRASLIRQRSAHRSPFGTRPSALPAGERRGVILLVVMVLLALFTMLMLAFVVATVATRQGVTYSSRVEQSGDPPSSLLHEALLQVVRGPRDNVSVIGPHSLLEDIYGAGTAGTIDLSSTYVTGTPLINVISSNSTSGFPAVNGVNTAYGYYAGLVITMLDGAAAGRSSRVVGYWYDTSLVPPGHVFQILRFDGIQPAVGDRYVINGRPFSGTGFGYTQASFLTNRLLGAVDPSLAIVDGMGNPIQLPYALLPNSRRGVFSPSAGYLDPAGPGGANEDYDAVDFQNMLMAMRVWSGTSLVTPLPSLHRPDLINYWNNVWLTRYTSGNDLITDATTYNLAVAQNLLRKICLRPLPMDHLNFTGSSGFSLSGTPPWDVDNDGDGQSDSVWVDLGMPVQTAADGRRYKPLFAVLCIDMDGKLNLNAHTSWRHVPIDNSSPNWGLSRFNSIFEPFALPTGAAAAQSYLLHVGSGYGPAEISLHPVFEPMFLTGTNTLLNPTGDLARLLGGDTTTAPAIEGRYGEIEISAGIFTPSAGITGIDDPLNWIRETTLSPINNWGTYPQTQYPYLPFTVPAGSHTLTLPFTTTSVNSSMWNGKWQYGTGSSYRTPPDLDGDGMVALDLRGQPMYIDYAAYFNFGLSGDAGWGEPNEAIDDPYELDLSLNAPLGGYTGTSAFASFTPNFLTTSGGIVSVDAPFTAAELERILRSSDWDATTLPDRIIRLAPNAFASTNPLRPYVPAQAQMQNLLTTHSFDLPVPSMMITSPDLAPRMIAAGYPLANSHITQLMAARIRIDTGNPTYPVDSTIQTMLAPEFIAGERMNINRPLGNGIDDNSNGVIDEPGEVESGLGVINTANGSVAVSFDLNNDGLADGQNAAGGSWGDVNGDQWLDGYDAPGMLTRQKMAGHLYVLMMLLADNYSGSAFLVQMDCDGNGTPGQPADTAYYFAQWAINIVDFFDSDSIMTPFEFDISPFTDDDGNVNNGTWDVDGIVVAANPPHAPTTSYPTNDDTQPFRGLVWGCERPELLITETLATHDRRTNDTTKGTGGNSNGTKLTTDPDPSVADDDFDQVRRPQGTLLVELFNPNPPVTVGGVIPGEAPSELYTAAGIDAVTNAPQFGVNLGQTVTSPSGTIWPVWRLATFKLAGASPPARNSARIPTLQPNQIDRVVYFVAATAVNAPLPTIEWQGLGTIPPQFYATAGYSAVVPPNSYAIVGPANTDPLDSTPGPLVTNFGKRDTTNDAGAAATDSYYPYRVQFAPTVSLLAATGGSYSTLTANTAISPPQYINPYGMATYLTTEVKQPISIPIATLFTNGTGSYVLDPTTALRWLRMSVSEPNGGYPIHSTVLPAPTATNKLNENATYDQSGQTLPDTPYDLDPTYFASDAYRQNGNKTDGTLSGYTIVFLQRLANPLMPWDLNANPYIIVDQLPVDLTAYNSENSSGAADPQATAGTTNFDSNRRGVALAASRNYNVFSQLSVDPTNAASISPGTMQKPLPYASFGFLNQELSALDSLTTPVRWWLNATTAATVVPSLASKPVVAAEYRGDPRYPFPWLNWNNRPFVSAKELLSVPLSSPSSLLSEMTVIVPGASWPPNSINPYEPGTGPLPQPPVLLGEFAHLPDVFHSPQYAGANPIPRNEFSPNLYRLLEYVQVPSRFTGTETWLPPQIMTGNPNAHQLHPPFNRVSRFRDPGRININTIFDPYVFQGLVDGAYGPQQLTVAGASPPWLNLWSAICNSRMGSPWTGALAPATAPATLPSYLQSNFAATSPSIFAAPFRSYAGHALVPLQTMRVESSGVEREVDGTQLRTLPTSIYYPLLEYPGPSPAGPYWSEPDRPIVPTPVDDPTRNPYFTYQAFRRLDNLLTTRSNVYAVWITVGYFEVTPAPTSDPQRSLKYPDGWMLGAEIGSDTGDIKRNRGFFLYDRTIPVGFERGENHNVERGILLERFIE